jgi:hypothetical protein
MQKHFSFVLFLEFFIFLVFLLSLIVGCTPSLKKNNSFFTNFEETHTPNANTQNFDQKLAAIKDQQSAQEAVDCFTQYVATRFKPVSANTLQANSSSNPNVSLFKNLLPTNSLAQTELNLRHASTASTSNITAFQENVTLSPSELAEKINATHPHGQLTTSAEISEIQKSVRQTIPHLAYDQNNQNMSPLEAASITWTYLTGDDGTMPPGTLDNKNISNLDQTTLQEKKISSQCFWMVAFLIITIADGINNTIIQLTEHDIFGNKIFEDEEVIFFVKFGRQTQRRSQVTRYYYYTMQDLQDTAAYFKPFVHIDNTRNKYGLAQLPSSPDQNSTYAKTASFKESDSPYLTLPMDRIAARLKIGDLIFHKSDQASMISNFSYWTHVAILKNIEKRKVFEAWPTYRGSDVYEIGENWQNVIAFSIRRIKHVSSSTIEKALNDAIDLWRYTPFRHDMRYPEELSFTEKIQYFRKWANKYDTDSMYCSKLVWWTFKDCCNIVDEKIDLDSNLVTLPAFHNNKFTYLLTSSDKNDDGYNVSRAFIGVAPDDIYGSKHLDYDLYFEEKDQKIGDFY